MPKKKKGGMNRFPIVMSVEIEQGGRKFFKAKGDPRDILPGLEEFALFSDLKKKKRSKKDAPK